MADTQQLTEQIYIEVDGNPNVDLMGDQLEVIVESSLQLPDVATIVVHDSTLRWVDDRALEPGKTLAIKARTEAGEEQPLFQGEIVEIEPDFRPGSQRFTVRAYDRMHRLARGTHVRSFLNVTDGDLVQKIAQELGLSANVGPTSQVHPYVLQANETNYAFLRRRAAALGYVLYMDDSTLCFKAPDADAAEVELKWAETLLEFHPRLTTVEQVVTDVVRGWDPDQRQEIVGKATNGDGTPKIGESRPGGQLAKQAYGVDAQRLTAAQPVRSQAEADRLAKALADRRASAFIEADGICKGNPKIVAGTALKIVSVGDRFSGTYVCTNARHVYDRAQSGYTTEFSITGQHPASLLALLVPEPKAAVGERMAIGVVTNNDDPDGLGRVKVKFPWLSPDHESNWARVVTPGGGKERGLEFLPEINDEVLVAFDLGDVDHPYVLGGLWNAKDKPAGDQGKVVSGGKVEQRIIRSRTGHKITIDDSDGASGIRIEDKNGNVIHLEATSDALTVKTKGNVKIESRGEVTVKAQASLSLEAAGPVTIRGMGITIDGGAGVVDVRGTLIKLN